MTPPKTDKAFPLPRSVQTTPELWHEVKVATVALLGTDARFRGRDPEIQAVSNALWLWFARLPKEEAASFLRAMYPRLESFLAGDPVPASPAVDFSPPEVHGQEPPDPPPADASARRRKQR